MRRLRRPKGRPGAFLHAAAAVAGQQFPDAGLALVHAVDAPLERAVVGEKVRGLAEVALVGVVAERAAQPLNLGDGFDVARLVSESP